MMSIVVYMGWIMYYFVRAIFTKLEFQRHKMLLRISSLMIFLYLIFFGWNIFTNFKKDYKETGGYMVISYLLPNLYVFYLMLMFCPSQSGVNSNQIQIINNFCVYLLFFRFHVTSKL